MVKALDERKKHSALDIQCEGVGDIWGMKENRLSHMTPLADVVAHGHLSRISASRNRCSAYTDPRLELLHCDWEQLGDIIIIKG